MTEVRLIRGMFVWKMIYIRVYLRIRYVLIAPDGLRFSLNPLNALIQKGYRTNGDKNLDFIRSADIVPYGLQMRAKEAQRQLCFLFLSRPDKIL